MSRIGGHKHTGTLGGLALRAKRRRSSLCFRPQRLELSRRVRSRLRRDGRRRRRATGRRSAEDPPAVACDGSNRVDHAKDDVRGGENVRDFGVGRRHGDALVVVATAAAVADARTEAPSEEPPGRPEVRGHRRPPRPSREHP
mmetsp:Transcript_2732/g.7079  ORF Transcript_2732/g.7079 Transcript_2732/m.7079 type:complete len:142 (+) Transcript_2732:293-718(+)